MHQRILAIDYGRVRHGLAASDGLGLAAHPLPVLVRGSAQQDSEHLRALLAEHDIQRLVVGLPLNMDGSEGPMAAEARAFARRLELDLGLEVALEDERLTTDEARTFLTEKGVRPAQQRALRDSVAAAILLRDVLDRERSADP